MSLKESDYVADCDSCGRKTAKLTREGERCPSCSSGHMVLREMRPLPTTDAERLRAEIELTGSLIRQINKLERANAELRRRLADADLNSGALS